MILSARYKDDVNNDMKVMTIVLLAISSLFLFVPWRLMKPRKYHNLSLDDIK